jgi:archaeosine-15-forming tRNA-guanine transglycosylase
LSTLLKDFQIGLDILNIVSNTIDIKFEGIKTMTVHQRKSMAISNISANGSRVLKLKKQDGYLVTTMNGEYITLKSLVALEAYAQGLKK